MPDHQSLKQRLYQTCLNAIEKHINAIEQNLASIEESRNNETKSSAGDKYETGRAMMQMEEEKCRAQLFQKLQLKNELAKIDLQKSYTKIETGSLVFTNLGTYFMAIGMGKIPLDGQVYFCISLDAPIGQQLKNKSVGEEVTFNNKQLIIKEIH